MDSLKRALVNALANREDIRERESTRNTDSSAGDPVAAAAVETASMSEPTFTITETQLREFLASGTARDFGPEAAAPATPGVTLITGPRQATMPEACVVYKLLTRLEQATSRMIIGTRDRVAVPGNLYVVDKASPMALALLAACCVVAASGAERVSAYFTRLAANTAAKSSDRSLR